jgi:hypothetical protein
MTWPDSRLKVWTSDIDLIITFHVKIAGQHAILVVASRHVATVRLCCVICIAMLAAGGRRMNECIPIHPLFPEGNCTINTYRKQFGFGSKWAFLWRQISVFSGVSRLIVNSFVYSFFQVSG